jgi:hypothetical protein
MLVKKTIKIQIKKHENYIADSSSRNPKILYAYLNRRRPISNTISTISHNGSTIHDLPTIVDIFNDTYLASFSDTSAQTLPHFPNRSPLPCPQPSFTVQDVEDKLSQLNISKAVGPDGIHPCILKRCAT